MQALCVVDFCRSTKQQHLYCSTTMDLFNEEFRELVRPSARKPGFTLGNLDGRLRKHPFAAPFDELEEAEETMAVFSVRLMGTLKQMMYVSGETAEPSHETTGMVEEIVRQQVIEMVCVQSIYSLRLCPGGMQRSNLPRMHKALNLLQQSLQGNLC